DQRIYADSGYYLARVINEGNFHIEHGRWVLALSQLLPLIGVKLGVPMKGLILLHSLGNVLFLAACMGFTARVLKNDRATLALAAVHLIGLTHGLFCPIFELYYGVDLLILFQGVLASDRSAPRTRWSLILLLFIGVVSSHLMALPLVAGVLLVGGHWRDRRLMLVLGSTLVVFLVLRSVTMSYYESGQLAFIKQLGSPARVLPLFSIGFLRTQLVRAFQHYPDVLLLAALNTVALWRTRRRRVLAIFWLGLLAIHVLTGLYMPWPMHDRYREQVDFAAPAWTVLVAILTVLPLLRWRPLVMAALLVCAGYRTIMAEWIAPYYEARTRWQQAWISEAHGLRLHKVIVDPAGVTFGPPGHKVSPYWSTGVECLLLSAKDGPQAAVSVITTDDLECPDVVTHLDKFVFRCWDVLDNDYLDPRYFKLPAGRYVPLARP
ncbi:MAG TPA: hypothetical protein VKG92_12055, partial [Flavobacteriales bacterium]|nr:hypothetical protein [Flavobacteriales bacterium]